MEITIRDLFAGRDRDRSASERAVTEMSDRTDMRTDMRTDKPDNFCDGSEFVAQFPIEQVVTSKAGGPIETGNVRFCPVFRTDAAGRGGKLTAGSGELCLLGIQTIVRFCRGKTMNATETGSGSQACRWTRLRTTFGPTVAGLLGGGLLGLTSLTFIEPLCRNVAATYAQYPNLEPPTIARFPGLPHWLSLLALAAGIVIPIATGAAVVWLVRPRDVWADLSAGLTAALACTLAAFASCIGWAVVLALVVVPSISDLTLLGDSVQVKAGVHPSKPLVEHYPDLKSVEPDQRGAKFMPKIVSDQVSGGLQSVWIGMLMALLTAGSLAMCGTLAAGHLMRRGGNWKRMIWPYFEITMPLTVAIGLFGALLLSPIWAISSSFNPFGFGPFWAAGLIVSSLFVVAGAIRRWPWLPRLCLAITWFILLTRPGFGLLGTVLPICSAVLTGILLVRLGLGRSRQMASATP